LALAAALLALASGAALAQEPAADAHADRTKVLGVRHWSYPSYTRVVIELTGPVEARLQRLPADAAAGRPERLYFDLPGVWVGHEWDTPKPVEDGLLAAIRLGQFESGAARAVIDLARYERHRVFALGGPDRIVPSRIRALRSPSFRRWRTCPRSRRPFRSGRRAWPSASCSWCSTPGTAATTRARSARADCARRTSRWRWRRTRSAGSRRAASTCC
jgi:hypothetical protein